MCGLPEFWAHLGNESFSQSGGLRRSGHLLSRGGGSCADFDRGRLYLRFGSFYADAEGMRLLAIVLPALLELTASHYLFCCC